MSVRTVVVLPVPPFWESTAIVWSSPCAGDTTRRALAGRGDILSPRLGVGCSVRSLPRPGPCAALDAEGTLRKLSR